MSIRTDLITEITTQLAGTSVRAVSELPFDSGDVPLYQKNKKTVYLSDADTEKVQLYRTLDQGDVYQTITSISAYLTVDAKNQPSDIDSVIDKLLTARTIVTGVQDSSAESIPDITDDYITYTIDYNFTNIN